jgi:hypothetical protein
MMTLRRFLSNETGTASIEFVLVIPIVMMIFMASVESSLYMVRHVMLERSVDIVVREIRMGNLDDLDHKQLKELFCTNSGLVPDVATCVKAMKVWMQPINTANFDMVAPPRDCVDRAENIEPPAPGLTEFRFGTDNEIMLLRICLKEEPMFPTTLVGARFVSFGEGDGNYALMTTSVFVNEPG